MAQASSCGEGIDHQMVSDVICVETPGLMDTVLAMVDDGRFQDLEALLKEGKNDRELCDITWDLVPLLCTFLTDSNQNDKPDTIKSCEIVFDYLCQVSRPKELILVLLEQANAFSDDVKFKILLVPMQKSLLLLNVKRSHSIAMALETLYAHIRTLPLPQAETQNLEGRERTVLHMDPAVRRICSVLTALVDFITPFVKAATNTQNYEEHSKERNDIINMLIKILNQPLVHLDLSYFADDVQQKPNAKNGPTKDTGTQKKKAKSKSEARVLTEEVAELFEQLHPDYLKLVDLAEQQNARREAQLREIRSRIDEDAPELEDTDDYGVEEEMPPNGIACLVYLTLGEQMAMQRFPCVYTPQHLLEFSLPFVCSFLEKPVAFQVEKGLKLLTTAFTRIPCSSLHSELMGLDSLATSIKYLIKAVIHCPSKEARKYAIRIFPLIHSKFDIKGKYLYLQYLLNKADHPGLLGYAINILKDQIDTTLKQETPSAFFVGTHLEKLLNYVFVLPEGATSDLLEESDRVLGALNLLRYLILRDNPKQNVTGIWNFIDNIDENYCNPLRTGVNMSRAHYQLEMDQTKAGKYLLKPGDPEMEITLGSDTMPNLTKDQQLHVLQRALYTFDMIDSVLGRVAELLDQQKKQSVP